MATPDPKSDLVRLVPLDAASDDFLTVTSSATEESYRALRLRKSGLPPRYRRHLKDLRWDWGDGHDEKRIAIVKICCDTVRAYRDASATPKTMLVHGAVGSGKTIIVGAMVYDLIWHGLDVYWRPYYAWREAVKQGYNGDTPVDTEDPIAAAIDTPLLIWDDFGPENPRHHNCITEDAYEKVRHVVASRYTHERPTIITTNLDPEGLRKWLLNDAVILSRLREDSIRIDMSDMPDLRKIAKGDDHED